MAEVAPLQRHNCDGCTRVFDGPDDLAPARVGVQLLRYCRRCYLTGLGPSYPVSFEIAQELGVT